MRLLSKSMISKNISLGLISLLFLGCGKSDNCDDSFSIDRTNFTGNQMKTQGYFFGEPYDDNEVRIYYFYRNGVFFHDDSQPLDAAENNTIEVDIENNSSKAFKDLWGVWNLTGNIIEIEHWYPSLRGCFKTIYEKGVLVNDSTFILTLRQIRDDGKVEFTETPNSTYFFRPLVEKPDSTNGFVN